MIRLPIVTRVCGLCILLFRTHAILNNLSLNVKNIVKTRMFNVAQQSVIQQTAVVHTALSSEVGKGSSTGLRISLPHISTKIQPARSMTTRGLWSSLRSFTVLSPELSREWNSKVVRSLQKIFRFVLLSVPTFIVTVVGLGLTHFLPIKKAWASAGPIGGGPIKSQFTPTQGALLWSVLFFLSAALHSAESAMTKISHWKVTEFAEEEGPKSPFATLSTNLTRLLSTILLLTTACSIYSTALFVATASEMFPSASLGVITAALTAVTLFFGELLPKALAVSNSELVARNTVPVISRISTLLLPVTSVITFLSDLLLRLAGMKSSSHTSDKNVSEDMLRLVVDEAQRSVAGIDSSEGRMIKAVLDMQDTEVSKIMQPRVDIIGVPETATAHDILNIVVENRYSRLPVYRGDKGLDNVVGVVYSKDLLEMLSKVLAPDETENPLDKEDEGEGKGEGNRGLFKRDWNSLTAVQVMSPTAYFIPETMSVWKALQEMRKRRVHLAIVVDEYGGTAGLVTFEDLLEQVVGEIYDEFDEEDEAVHLQNISRRVNPDGSGSATFEMKGVAYLDDVFEALGLEYSEKDLDGDYATIGGFLCSQAGAIPSSGDAFVFAGYKFTVKEVEDNRRIVTLTAEKLREGQNSEGSIASGVEQKGAEATSSPLRLPHTIPIFLPWAQVHGNQPPDSAEDGPGTTAGETNVSEDCGENSDGASGSGALTFRDGEWVEVGSDRSGGGGDL